jgi:hypothetical protein
MQTEKITSASFEKPSEWKLEERVRQICEDPSDPRYQTLEKLFGLIVEFGQASKILDESEAALQEDLRHIILADIPLLSVLLGEDDAEHSYGVATDNFVERHDQIRGYFRELNLGWYLRDQHSYLHFVQPSTIFAVAMHQIEGVCKTFEMKTPGRKWSSPSTA